MEEVVRFLNSNMLYIVMVLGGISFILLVALCFTNRKLKKLQDRFERFMAKDDLDLEELLVKYTGKINEIEQQENMLMESIKKIDEQLVTCVQKVGVVRYKAIANTGADLSFAIALLDEQNNGVVLNGIYSRDGSYTYAKPVQGAQSTYNLSEEEEQAIQKAINHISM